MNSNECANYFSALYQENGSCLNIFPR